MEVYYRFQYLHIQDLWPASDEELSHYAHQVRLLWNADVPEPLRSVLMEMSLAMEPLERIVSRTPSAIIQVCLLRTKLFRDCEDDQIRDSRDIKSWPQGQGVFLCRDRALLIQKLADTLLQCEYALQAFVTGTKARRAQWEQVLAFARAENDAYSSLYWGTRRLAARSRKFGLLSPTQFTAAEQYLRQLQQAIPAVETLPLKSLLDTSTRLSVLVHLYVALRCYGPSKDDGYTEDAVYYAMAEILMGFGIEKRAKTVAPSLYRFLTRHLPSLKTRRARHSS